jgi:hypothetical protein
MFLSRSSAMKIAFSSVASLVRLSCGLMTLPVAAADITWTNLAGGNWNAATNWSTQTVPGSADNVFITNSGTYTVTLNLSASVLSLVLGGGSGTQRLTNNLVGNTLTLGAASFVEPSGVLGWGNGTLTGSGDLDVRGAVLWNGGTIGGLGTLAISPQGSLTLGGTLLKTISGRPLVNSGSVVWSGTGDIAFNVGAITNLATGIFEIQNNEPMTDQDGSGSPASLVNLGLIRKVSGTGTSSITGVTLQNRGSLSVQSGTLTWAGSLNNSGSCEVPLGTLNLSGGGDHSGVFDCSMLGLVNFSGGTHTLEAGASLTGPGTHRLSGTSATLTLAGAVQASSLEVTAGTLGGGGDLTVTNVLTWSAGTFTGAGNTTVPAGAQLAMSGTASKTLSGRTLTLGGSGVWTGTGGLQFASGSFVILPGGVFDIQNNVAITDGDGPNTSATFNVGGTLQKSVGTQTTTFSGVSLNNTGVVQVLSGTLAVAGGSSGGSFLASGPTSVVNFSSGAHALQNSATLTGSGLHRVSGTSTLLTIAGAVLAENLELVTGTIDGSGTLTATNGFGWSGGTLTGAGSLVIPRGGSLSISGSAAKVLNGRTIQNSGSATWTGTGDLQIRAGLFENQAEGVFLAQNSEPVSDTDGVATAATFQNVGTFRKAGDIGTTTFTGVTFNNSGLVAVDDGTLLLAGGVGSGRFVATSADSTLTFGSGTYALDAGSSLTGPGLARLSGSTTTLNINTNLTCERFELVSGTLSGAGTLTVSTGFNWAGGSQTGSGVTEIAPAATLTLSGASTRTLAGRTMLNRGIATWTATSSLVLNSGLFRNAQGGVFEAQNDRTINDNDGSQTSATFLNEGTFRKTVATGVTSVSGVAFNNNGVVELQTGSLTLGGGNSSGTFVLPGASTLLLFGAGTNRLDSGSVLQGAGVFRLSGGLTVLEIAGNIPAPRFEQSSGTLTGNGSLQVLGTYSWSGGTMSGSGSLEIPQAGKLDISGSSSVTLAGRTINTSGLTTFNLNGNFLFNSGRFDNLPGAVLELQNDRTFSDNDGPSTAAILLNQGVIQKNPASGQFGFYGLVVTNLGTISVTNWTLTLAGPFFNDGVCTVENSNINIQGDGSSSGVFATTTPASRIIFSSGNQQLRHGARLTGSGTNEIGFATIEVAGSVGVDKLALLGGGSITGAGGLSITNLFRWTYGNLTGTGNIMLRPGGTLWLTGDGSRVIDGRTFDNFGTVQLGGSFASLSLDRGAFNNQPGALFEFVDNGSVWDSNGSGTPSTFNNAGKVRISGLSSSAYIDTGTFTNSGIVEVVDSTFTSSAAWSHSGSCLLSNAILALHGGGTIGGPFNLGSGAVAALELGSFVLGSGTSFTGPGTLRIDGGTVDAAVALSIGQLEQRSGILTGAGTVTISNTFAWSGGSQAGPGITLISPGASLNVTNSGTAEIAGRTLRNSGTVASTGSFFGSDVRFSSGLIENLAGGVFEVQGGGGFFDSDGTPTVPAFRNLGTFRRGGVGDASFAGVAFTNSGSVLLNAGTTQFGSYSQTVGSTLLAGYLTALGISLEGGVLSGAGVIQSGSFVNSATIAPGSSVGLISIVGPFFQTSQGRLSVEVGGTVFSLFDSLQVSGPATIGGQLDVSIVGGYVPGALDEIPILSAQQLSGQFTTVTGGAVGSDFALRPHYTPTSVLLELDRATNTPSANLSFGAPQLLPNGNIQLVINGAQGASFLLQASTNLVYWTDVVPVNNSGPSFTFTVTNTLAYPALFFRTKQ